MLNKLKLFSSNVLNNMLLLSVFVNSVLFLFTYLVFVPAFNTNDDVGMMRQVFGILKGSGSTIYIKYTNIIIAYVLQFLYTYFGNVIWYELYHIFSLFVVHTVFLYIGLKSFAKKQNVLFIYLLYFLFVATTLLLNIQFTIEAALLVLSGLSLIFFPLNKKISKWELFFGFLLIVFGSLVRIKSLYLAIGIFFPLILLFLLSYRKNIVLKKLIVQFAVVVFALFTSFGLLKFNHYLYQKNGFPENQFYEYNSLRGKIMDYKVLDQYSDSDKSKILESVNWSQNDLNMLKAWFFLDNDTYNITKLKKINNNKFEKKTVVKKITLNSFSNIFNIFKDPNVQFVFIYLSIIILVFKIEFKELLILLSYLLFSVFLLYLIYLMLKPPPFRVYINLFAFLGIFPIFIGNNITYRSYIIRTKSDFRIKKILRSKKSIGSFLILFLVIVTLYKLVEYRIQESNKRIENNLVLNKLLVKLSDSNKIYINQGGMIGWENLAYLKSKYFLKELSIISLGTSTHTSYTYNKLKKAGINNLYLDLLYRDDIYYITNSRYADYYRIFMKEHYNIDVISLPIYKKNNVEIYKMLVADSVLTNKNNILVDENMNNFTNGIVNNWINYPDYVKLIKCDSIFHSKPFSIQIVNKSKNGAGSAGLLIDTLEPGQYYYTEAWVYSTKKTIFGVKLLDNNMFTAKVEKEKWTKINGVLKACGTKLWVFSHTDKGNNNVGSKCFVDDIKVIKISIKNLDIPFKEQ